MKTPALVTTVTELRTEVESWRQDGLRVALIPTMGALHEGHLSLIAAARGLSDRTIVSIFVNPAQFAPHEDFGRYPRDLGRDCAYLARHGLSDLVFAPDTGELYPEGFATRVEVSGPALGLESEFRPHFFAGVATVVAKLLIAMRPDMAVFGEKDYQQLLVVRRLARDLGIDAEIVGAPIVRDESGLALSSRNAYLDPQERSVARCLNVALAEAARALRQGRSVSDVEGAGRRTLLDAGFESVDYFAVRDARTLTPVSTPAGELRVLAAARIGGVRLIDNLNVEL